MPNLVIEKEQEATLLVLVYDEQLKTKENMWYFDNGANNGICGNKDKFMEFNEIFVDYSKVFIKRKDMILIQIENNSY